MQKTMTTTSSQNAASCFAWTEVNSAASCFAWIEGTRANQRPTVSLSLENVKVAVV